MSEKVKITAYVMVPVYIDVDTTAPHPERGDQFQDWFHEQLRLGVERFDDTHVVLDEAFVDVGEFAIGTSCQRSLLSEYRDKELYKELSRSVESKLLDLKKIQDVIRYA